VLIASEGDPFPEDVHRHDSLGASARAEHLALLGKPLAGLHIELVLVLEAAEQPAAPTRDLGRVEGEVLVLRQGKAHGGEGVEP